MAHGTPCGMEVVGHSMATCCCACSRARHITLEHTGRGHKQPAPTHPPTRLPLPLLLATHRAGSKPAAMASLSSLPLTSTAPAPAEARARIMTRLLLACRWVGGQHREERRGGGGGVGCAFWPAACRLYLAMLPHLAPLNAV